MTQLVSYYENKPIDLNGKVEITQYAMESAANIPSSEGAVQPRVVYVAVPSPTTGSVAGPLRCVRPVVAARPLQRGASHHEHLGASTVLCESYRTVTWRTRLRLFVGVKGADVTFQKVENSGFDFHHVGTGSEPRDPSPLRWPDEPGFGAALVSVLENKSTGVTINIRSNNTFSVDSSLGIRLKKLGFELGSGHENTGVSSLHITAHFPAPPKKGWL